MDTLKPNEEGTRRIQILQMNLHYEYLLCPSSRAILDLNANTMKIFTEDD